VTVRYPTQALLAMAAEMTIPKVAWMLVRGIGRRNAYKIAAVMVLPVVSFLCGLVRHHQSAWCRVEGRTDAWGAVPRGRASDWCDFEVADEQGLAALRCCEITQPLEHSGVKSVPDAAPRF
jgi:hypothetical protein